MKVVYLDKGYNPSEPRDDDGRWTSGGRTGGGKKPAAAEGETPTQYSSRLLSSTREVKESWNKVNSIKMKMVKAETDFGRAITLSDPIDSATFEEHAKKIGGKKVKEGVMEVPTSSGKPAYFIFAGYSDMFYVNLKRSHLRSRVSLNPPQLNHGTSTTDPHAV